MAICVGALLTSLVPAEAGAVTVRDLQSVSGAPPFPASCTPSVQPLPSDAAGEPRIAVDPRDTRHMVISYGQLPSVLTMATRDGGKTWRRALPPGVSRCTGGPSDFTGDPFVSIAGDGTAYLSSVPVNLPLPNTTLAPRSWIAINHSTDNAASWSQPAMVAPDDGSFWDKAWVVGDPRRPGVAYAAFLKRSQPDGSSSWFAKTSDGGRTFTPPLETIPDQQLAYPHDPQLLVLPGGRLVQVYVSFNESYQLAQNARVPVEMRAIRSDDGGAHWSASTLIAQAPNNVAEEPDSGQGIDAVVFPSAAVGPDGAIYAAWAEIDSTESARIALSKSTNAGLTWTKPAIVARVPAQAWLPTVAVGRDGTVGVTWYDARRDRRGDGQFTTDVWFAYSSGGGGGTWRRSHLAGPFDMLSAGRRDGRPFLGDYFGLAPVPGGFAAAFAQAKPRSGDFHSVVFYARIVLGRGARPLLRIRVRPRRAIAGRRTTFRFSVTTRARRPVPGAAIRFAGRRARTGRRGRASLTVALRRRGHYRARASTNGYRSATAVVRSSRRR